MVSRTTRPDDRPRRAAGRLRVRAWGLALWLTLVAAAGAQTPGESPDWFGNPFADPGEIYADETEVHLWEHNPAIEDPAYGGHSMLQGAPAQSWQSPWTPPAAPPLQLDSSPTPSWGLEILPDGLLYKSYLAGPKEPRIGSSWLVEEERGLIWETVVGGRAGVWRWEDATSPRPLAAQLDLEGGALVRMDPEVNTDVEAVDFRFGVLMTWRSGRWASKAGYYHISSHLGDEYLLKNPGVPRYNYVRDAAITGLSFDATPDVRLYSEIAYAIGHQGGALPLELQFGAEYAPAQPSEIWGAPFAAVNSHVREDEGWIHGVNVMAGWLWRGEVSRHTLRIGMQYYTGPSLQWSFVGRDEQLIGGGLWFDY